MSVTHEERGTGSDVETVTKLYYFLSTRAPTNPEVLHEMGALFHLSSEVYSSYAN